MRPTWSYGDVDGADPRADRDLALLERTEGGDERLASVGRGQATDVDAADANARQDAAGIGLAVGDEPDQDDRDPEQRAEHEASRPAPRSWDPQGTDCRRDLFGDGHRLINPERTRASASVRTGAYGMRGQTKRGNSSAKRAKRRGSCVRLSPAGARRRHSGR